MVEGVVNYINVSDLATSQILSCFDVTRIVFASEEFDDFNRRVVYIISLSEESNDTSEYYDCFTYSYDPKYSKFYRDNNVWIGILENTNLPELSELASYSEWYGENFYNFVVNSDNKKLYYLYNQYKLLQELDNYA